MSMNPEDYIRKCRIQLNKEHPFFSHIVNRLNLVETEEKPTMAVDHRGNLYYNKDFVQEVVDEDGLEALKAVIIHEGLHVALHGHQRLGSRDAQLWNVAQDIVINHVVVNDEGYPFPSKVELVPETDGEMVLEESNVTIEDVTTESFESVYEKIAQEIDNQQQQNGGQQGQQGEQDGQGQGQGQGQEQQGQGKPSSFDDPVYSDEDEDGEGQGGGEEVPQDVDEGDLVGMDKSKEETEAEWDKIVEGAENQARRQGHTGGGLYEDIVNNQDNEERDYSKHIRERVKSNMPSDYTYMSPNKKSRSTGAYFPDMDNGEKVEVIVTLDTSGSMTQEDLVRCLGEIASIISSFDEVNLTLMQHDVEVNEIEEYENPSKEDFKELEAKGRGGTSHEPVFKKVEELQQESKENFVVVSLTDGYTTVPEQAPINENDILWVINNYSVGLDRLKYGKIIRNANE